jgi:hypothetical protein
MLLYRLDNEVINLPYIADTRDESIKLIKRNSLLGINYCYKGVTIYGMQTERNLG